jgi:hypothetical protein
VTGPLLFVPTGEAYVFFIACLLIIQNTQLGAVHDVDVTRRRLDGGRVPVYSNERDTLCLLRAYKLRDSSFLGRGDLQIQLALHLPVLRELNSRTGQLGRRAGSRTGNVKLVANNLQNLRTRRGQRELQLLREVRGDTVPAVVGVKYWLAPPSTILPNWR